MKLATVRFNNEIYAGVVQGDSFYSFVDLDSKLPNDMLPFIENYESLKPYVETGIKNTKPTCTITDATFLAPLRNPISLRDFLGFEEHAKNSGKRFGMDMSKSLENWYTTSAFYYSNSNGINGSDEPIEMHPSSQMFDFEFEIGFVIGKKGKNIAAADAGNYIFGFTIFNDWSARDIQLQEMKTGMGAPKGKDYANTIGPVIVTKDELDQYLCKNDPQRYDLATKLTRNGVLMRENNVKTIYHTFAGMIEWASKDRDIYPGELFGSGTIGGGALLEYSPEIPWVNSGDVIEMEVQGIGILKNIVK